MQECRSKCIWGWGYISLESISVIKVATECRNEGTNSKSQALRIWNIYFNYKFILGVIVCPYHYKYKLIRSGEFEKRFT